MKIEQVYAFLDTLSPFELQEAWDNSGLIVGSMQDEVEQICLSLELDSEVLQQAPDKTLFITHHPLIFSALKRLDFTKYPANIIKALAKKECAALAMHTNIDKTHLNRYVVERILGLKVAKSSDFVCYFDTDMSFDELCTFVSEKFGIEHLKVVNGAQNIKRVAICTGSGGDLIGEIEAECFISGDLKYHHAVAAKENGLGLIDIGHFESERYFTGILEEYLKKFPLKVIIADSKNPFEYFHSKNSKN
ncbi:MAG: Nif3-like dinuclear metal center hexameric protein [Campylobacteraceae bacterium]|jgi:dinuclear metal center YbgI/SA1388 family protein|nr:Nif3-like dinuclear metal center hexameric protein [Campylobacteraceae bacterium]